MPCEAIGCFQAGDDLASPVVVVVNEEAVVAFAIGPHGVGEGHALVAVVHRPHPELHSHSGCREVLEVGDQQHLQRTVSRFSCFRCALWLTAADESHENGCYSVRLV